MFQEKLRLLILYFPAFLFALSFHESAHAYVANRLGDPTAKMLGRVTLNPLPHMDLFGTFLLPLFTWFSPGLIPIAGWGKPVPVDYRSLASPRRDGMWIALAGPMSNFFLAIFFSTMLRGLQQTLPFIPESWLINSPVFLMVLKGGLQIIQVSIWINLALGVFNLIPIHPLDGGKVLTGILPHRWAVSYDRFARYGMIVLFGMFYLGGFRYLQYPIRFLAERLIPA
jgi:Zn-dependent protease